MQKQVDMINKQLNMGVSIENIVSDVDISSSLQNSSVEVKNKVSWEGLDMTVFVYVANETWKDH